MLPPDVASRTYNAHKQFYDQLQRDVARRSRDSRAIDPDAAPQQPNLFTLGPAAGFAKQQPFSV
jgi:hypothetical protein